MLSPVKSLVRVSLLAVVLSAGLSQAQSAMHRQGYLLDGNESDRDFVLSLHGVLPWGYFGYAGAFPIGAGASFYVPLVRRGFLPRVNDEFGLDFGADAIFFTGYADPFAVFVPVSVLWTFHFTPTFSAYFKAGAAVRFWPGYVNAVYPDFIVGAGLSWMFASKVGLRIEAGYPGLKIGVIFGF